MAAQTQGGWKGYIDLASDHDGNLTLFLRLEDYAAKNYAHGQPAAFAAGCLFVGTTRLASLILMALLRT